MHIPEIMKLSRAVTNFFGIKSGPKELEKLVAFHVNMQGKNTVIIDNTCRNVKIFFVPIYLNYQ